VEQYLDEPMPVGKVARRGVDPVFERGLVLGHGGQVRVVLLGRQLPAVIRALGSRSTVLLVLFPA
jgi:hypothetical protein